MVVVPEHHSYTFSGFGHLGDAVVVSALAGTAHDDEVPVASRPTDRASTPFRADPKGSRLTEGKDGHGGSRQVAGDPIAMPGDAVTAVSIQVAGDALELCPIAVAERLRHLANHFETGGKFTGPECCH